MENSIIRGTTPTIEFTFSVVSVTDLDEAVFTLEVDGVNIVERELDTATLGTASLIWTLTQTETLSLAANRVARATCTWLTSGGVRGQSKTVSYVISDTPINEVMGDADGSY